MKLYLSISIFIFSNIFYGQNCSLPLIKLTVKRSEVLKITDPEVLLDYVKKNQDLFNTQSIANLPLSHLRKRRDIIKHAKEISGQSVDSEFQLISLDFMNLQREVEKSILKKGIASDVKSVMIQSKNQNSLLNSDQLIKLKSDLEYIKNFGKFGRGHAPNMIVKMQIDGIDRLINNFNLPPSPAAKQFNFTLLDKKSLVGSFDSRSYLKIGSRESSVESGVNSAFLVKSNDEIKSVYKPISSSSRTDRMTNPINNLNKFGIKAKTSHYREEAAYFVDQELGLGVVPPTRVVDLKDGVGSVQEFANLSEQAAKVLTRENDHSLPLRLRSRPNKVDEKIAILDIVIGNVDRHRGNFLISNKGATVAIDNGYSFPEIVGEGDSDYKWGWRSYMNDPFSQESLEIIENIDIKKLSKKLSTQYHIEEKALELMKKRVNVMKSSLKENPKATIDEIAELVIKK